MDKQANGAGCNPVWPCAMTGACSVLCGFSGLSVIIHGSSGCYFYPKSLMKVPVYSTFLIESEVVMGSARRLAEVISQVPRKGGIAVLNTCVPALTGEDLASAVPEDTIFVDAPGFCGGLETGMQKAYEALAIPVTGRDGVNIDGVSRFDLFARGNVHEAKRILAQLGIPAALTLAYDSWENLQKGAAARTVSVNPGFASGVGEMQGSLLFTELRATVAKLCDAFSNAAPDALLKDWQAADEKMYYYADKFLRKYNPPRVLAAGPDSYAAFAKSMMQRYFGSDVLCLPRSEVTDLEKIAQAVAEFGPDLVAGSTFEANLAPEAAFFGIASPDRSRVSFAARPICGIEGACFFIEGILNAAMDKQR
ncbi:MAG TPA: oxidoreductase [Methanocorpusculum sp.]|nr:oxidoreductase [Methanocorpusculum sp.]